MVLLFPLASGCWRPTCRNKASVANRQAAAHRVVLYTDRSVALSSVDSKFLWSFFSGAAALPAAGTFCVPQAALSALLSLPCVVPAPSVRLKPAHVLSCCYIWRPGRSCCRRTKLWDCVSCRVWARSTTCSRSPAGRVQQTPSSNNSHYRLVNYGYPQLEHRGL